MYLNSREFALWRVNLFESVRISVEISTEVEYAGNLC
jgi:hypothetical protein